MKDNLIDKLTFSFALDIIELTKKLKVNKEFIIANQLLKCGTSIGANVEEAIAGQSRRDFISKLSIASKEAREAKYWLLLIDASDFVDVCKQLEDVEHIIKILTKIIITSQSKI